MCIVLCNFFWINIIIANMKQVGCLSHSYNIICFNKRYTAHHEKVQLPAITVLTTIYVFCASTLSHSSWFWQHYRRNISCLLSQVSCHTVYISNARGRCWKTLDPSQKTLWHVQLTVLKSFGSWHAVYSNLCHCNLRWKQFPYSPLKNKN